MNNQLIPFNFENRQIRVTLESDEPWFVAQDVARALDYPDSSNPARLCKHVPEEWAGMKRIHTRSENGVIQARDMLCLSEQGLYFFLGRSDKPKALPFQKKVAGEILPQIRKTGASVPDDALQNLKDLQERVLELELNRSVTEKMLLRAQRTIERFENRNFLSSGDKREILTLYCRKYPISAIQRITKKGRTRITNFINEVLRGDDEAFDAMFAEWGRDDESSESFSEPLVDAARKTEAGL
jgi:prophage antirepressor-like protein